MPHLVLQYTANLESKTDFTALCRGLADALVGMRDDAGAPVFPPGGTRVLAYPAAHHAVADGSGDYGFLYLNLRIADGRSPALQQAIGTLLLNTVQQHLAPIFEHERIGVTVQVDDSSAVVYDGKHSRLHDLFKR